jgi:hypothetical protein
VVSFPHVPAAIGIAGAQAGALGRAAGEQRDRGGVQPGAPVVSRALFAGEDADAGFQQGVDERLQPAAGSFGLAGVIGLVRALRSCPVSRRFFGSGEGSMTEQMAPKQ